MWSSHILKRLVALLAFGVVLVAAAERTGPWTKEKAWEWSKAQPWIRGCNYMPASAANRFDIAVRLAARHPESVGKILLDSPVFSGEMAKLFFSGEAGTPPPRQPVLLLYGDADPHADSYKDRVETFQIIRRAGYGHRPFGLDPDKTKPIVDFFYKK